MQFVGEALDGTMSRAPFAPRLARVATIGRWALLALTHGLSPASKAPKGVERLNLLAHNPTPGNLARSAANAIGDG